MQIQDNSEIFNISTDPDKDPLYPGSSVTLGTIMLLLALFVTKHNIVGDGIQQLLNIIAISLPNGHRLCTSLHGFKSFFKNLKNPIVKHFYCGHCLGKIMNSQVNRCPYGACRKQLGQGGEYFLEMPVDSQIKSLLQQKGFYSSLQHRFTNSVQGKFSDIYDGSLYKKYVDNDGPLSNPDNISFTFNTDGASVFKSSNVSVWPLFLVINELPYKLRMKTENMILAGLWFGKTKPAMGTFLQPFLQTFKSFEKGLHVYSPDRGEFTCKAYLLCGTADLPARCLLCNGIQFNGSFSCWKCLQSGETAKVGKGHTHVFPFLSDGPKSPPRTKESVLSDSRKALDQQESGIKKYTVNGVKGPSWLTFFPEFDVVSGIAIDYMHGVLLGIQKLLLSLWFSSSHKGKPYNFFHRVLEVDARLMSIQPTLNITRLPRSIQTDIKYWKASEYRSFLLYYGAPILKGILDSERFVHFLLLVNAMHILLMSGSTLSDINSAELMLFEFVKQFSILYDTCFMTLNLHQLVHLADSVRTLGPLFTHSCFPFEDKNGVLLKMIRGTQNIDNQIITGLSFLQKLPELKLKTIVQGSELETLYNSIEHPNILTRGLKIANKIFVLGAVKYMVLSDEEHSALCRAVGYDPVFGESVKYFKRLEYNDYLIYGLSYKRMKKRDNSAIRYQMVHNSETSIFYGRVRHFIFVSVDENIENNTFAVVEKLSCKHSSCSSIVSVAESNIVTVIPLKCILESVLYISFKNKDGSKTAYVCKFPNNLEYD